MWVFKNRTRRDEVDFKLLTSTLTASFGGYSTSKWT